MAEGIIHDTESKMEEFKDQLPADEVGLPCCLFIKSFLKSKMNMYGCVALLGHVLSESSFLNLFCKCNLGNYYFITNLLIVSHNVHINNFCNIPQSRKHYMLPYA